MLVKPGANDELYFGSLGKIKIMIYANLATIGNVLVNEYADLATINNVWSRICQSRDNKQCYQNEIYDIGTEILTRSRFFTEVKKSFYESIIPQEIKSAGHSPSSGSVKSRFKTIFKK